MAEYIANTAQTIASNQNVLFTDTVICGNGCISHRNGSGLVTVKGNTNQCKARYKVFFSGNIAIPSTGTAEAISLAISLDGEPIASSAMIQTPTATEAYSNVSAEIIVEAPRGCCETVAVKNTSTQSMLVQNANFIVERVA